MEAFLTLVYLILFSWLVYRTPFFRNAGISPFILTVYFICCILLGWGHLWFAWKFFPNHGDMWLFYSEGKKLKHLLLNDFPGFLKEMQVDVYEQGVLTSGSLVIRIQYQFMSFVYMLFNLFSFSNNYVNIVVSGYVVMFGKIGLYRAAQRWTPKNHLGNLFFLVLPGMLFWIGVIHKEAIIYIALGLMLFYLRRKLYPGLLLVIIAFILIFFTRSYVIGLVFLGLLAGAFWTIAKDSNRYILLFIMGIGVFVFHCFYPQKIEWLLEQVITRKTEFESLKANTLLPFINLKPSLHSFFIHLPAAFRNGFFLPYPGQFNLLYSSFSIEIYFVLVVLLGALQVKKWNFLLAFSLVFGIAGVLLTGYTVPFAGALVRYRSIYLPFLMYVGFEGWKEFPLLKVIDARLSKLLNYNFFYISK